MVIVFGLPVKVSLIQLPSNRIPLTGGPGSIVTQPVMQLEMRRMIFEENFLI
jgi:hypothetical protein